MRLFDQLQILTEEDPSLRAPATRLMSRGFRGAQIGANIAAVSASVQAIVYPQVAFHETVIAVTSGLTAIKTSQLSNDLWNDQPIRRDSLPLVVRDIREVRKALRNCR